MIIRDGKAYFHCADADYGPGGIDGVSQVFPPRDVVEVRDGVIRGLMAVAGDGADLPAAALGLCAIPLGVEAMTTFGAVMTLADLRARNVEAVPEASMRLLPALQAGLEVPPNAYVRMMQAGPPRRKAWRGPLRWARSLIQNDAISRYPVGGANPQRDIHVLTLNELIHVHARTSPDRVVFRPAECWLEPAPGGPKDVPASVLNAAIDCIADVFQRHGADVSIALPHLRRQVAMFAGYTLHHLEHVLARPEKLPRRLWTGTGSMAWARILRYCVRRDGGEVTGHDHGAGGAHVDSPYKSMMEFEACDVFAAFSTTAGERLLALTDPALQMQADLPRLTVPEGAFAGAVLPPSAKGGDRTHADKIHRVFVLTGLTSVEHRYLKPRPAPLIRNDYLCRLLSGLAERGYDVVLKPHPEDTEVLAQDVLQKLGARLETRPIEEIMGEADMIICNAFQSTSFASVVLGGAKIVLADVHTDRLTAEARALLERRCAIVDPRLDAQNRLVVDLDAVLAGMDAATTLHDSGFADIFFGGSDAPYRENRQPA